MTDVDYYHIDNIEKKNIVIMYPPNSTYHKKIIPVKVTVDYIKNKLNENNSVFFKIRKRVVGWPLFTDYYFTTSYIIIDKDTYDKIISNRFYFGSGFPRKIGEKGVMSSMLLGWSAPAEMISKFDFFYPNIKLGTPGTGTSLLALSYKALEKSNSTDKIQIRLRRNIKNL